MATLFTLIHLAALVAFIVFFIKSRKLKKAGEDNGQAKKIMLASAIAWLVSFILVGVTAPPSEKSEEVATSEVSAESTVETVKEEPTDSSKQEVTSDEAVKEESVAEASVEEPIDEKEAAQEAFNASFTDSAKNFSSEVRNDKTGKWRLYTTSTSEDIVDHAADYYRAYFASDDELHWVVNFHPRQDSTTVIRVIDDKTLGVTEHKRVESEEHDASALGGGDVIADYFVDIETGAVEKID